MKRRLLLNTASNYVIFVLQIVIAFVMTPLYVEYMGLRDYGLWEVVISIIGYAGMLDLGLWPTISRFASKYAAEGDQTKQEETFATAIVFLSLIGIAASIFVVALVIVLEHSLFFGPGEDVFYYRIFLLILVVNVLIKFPAIVLEAYLEGQQRYWLKNLISVITLSTGTAVVYSLIDQTRGLLLLAIVSVAGLTIKASLYLGMVFRNSTQRFSFHISRFSRSHLRVLLRFGIKSFIQGAASRATSQSSPVIIAAFASTALVPIYTIPASLVRYSINLLMTSTHVFMPLFSELSAQGKSGRIQTIFVASNNLVVAVGVLLLVGIATVGPAFVGVWISPEIGGGSGPILFWLAIGGLQLGLNPLGSRFLTAIDRHGVYARYAPPIAIVSVASSIALFPSFGLGGLAAGMAVPGVLALPIFIRAVCIGLDISILRYVSSSILPTIVPAALTVAGWWVYVKHVGHPDDYRSILGLSFAMSLVYVVSFLIGDHLRPRQERVVTLLRQM